MRRDLPEHLVEVFPRTHRRLRIAVVTETYPPEINGVSLSLKRVVDGLRERDHVVQVVRPRQPRADPKITRADPDADVLMWGMPIPRYPDMRLGLPSSNRLQSLWADHRPDVVHIATEGPLGWSALWTARKLRIPVTSDFRTNFHAYSGHYGVGWLSKPILALLKGFHNQTSCTMVPTASLAARLGAAGFERVKVVSRGVDIERFNPGHRSEAMRAAWGATPSTTIIMCVSRLANEKNLPLLIRAYEQARTVLRNVKLVLVGDGPARTALRRLAPDAIFTGTQNGVSLSQHYASGDIFGFPSQTETFGNVVLEAMSSGLAVVALDYAAAAEIIEEGQNGLVAGVGDDDTFVQRIMELVTDPARALRLGAAARTTVLGRNWQQIVEQVEVVLLQVVVAGADGLTYPQQPRQLQRL